MLNLNLEKQQVIVFGAARGIGHATAMGFAAQGCRVVGFDRNTPAINEADSIDFLNGDVTAIDDVRRVANNHPEAQHIIYSVGIGSGKVGFPFWNLDPSDWGRVIQLNLMGAINVAHAFAPRLAERRCGTFLFVVSVAGQIGSQTDPPYSAAKAALINFTQCAAKDLAPYGVRVNALSPGMVQTVLNRSVWEASQARLPPTKQQTYEDWAESKLRRVSPLGRWQTTNECAAMAVFLASEQARNITGQTINIDGGQVMHS